MEIAKTYDPSAVEDKWYQYWLANKYFAAKPNPAKEPYCIVIPPPNVTGQLHMGHMLNNTIQDILVRRARMQGKEACWVPGTDHASIATEAKVVGMLKERGIDKKSISRDEFLTYAWEWKEKYGGIILDQLKKLGASCDWDRTRFTMEESLSEAVTDVFVDLYSKGKIYRAYRMVNWDPKGKTALSDEEVIYKEIQSKLYYIHYPIAPQPPKGEFGYQTADPTMYSLLKEHAQKHRNQPTEAEAMLWNLLSGDKMAEHHFRRQHIIGTYIADFICLRKRLIIEVDGLIHQLPENKASDEERTQWLASQGYRVIRFSNNEVLYNLEKVADMILEELKTPPLGVGGLTIATTRPETILADTAICVNPNDERYQHLIGEKVIVPFINREIPIIADEYVTMDFGTGALKVTPAHDLNDYELGKKYNLPVIDILNDDGTLNEKCGIAEYIGKDRFAVRKQIAKDLEEAGFLEKTEDYKSNVGYSERNPESVVEPKVSLQWWLKMDELAQPALENVLNDTIQFHPGRFKNLYRSWMENIKDWCISRQLWWGQRIPAWYDKQGNFVVARNHEEALKAYQVTYPDSGEMQLTQDEDVLDTWFSSWLWPISVFDGLKDPNNPDISYFYPTNDLVTGPDIIFFWVARMIVSGYEYRHEPPFKNVYFTGIIRDQYGRKMSKQLGNSPDPIALMERYGADGVRTGLLFSSPAGNDLIFDTPVPESKDPEKIAEFQRHNDVLSSKLCEQGRNFNNKIWNAFRLLKGWQTDASIAASTADQTAIRWFEANFDQKLIELEKLFAEYRMSEALLTVYNLAWDDFCSWYLEMIKPEFGQPISLEVYQTTVEIFDRLLRVIHPFMPFITEEIWQNLTERNPDDSICIAAYPQVQNRDTQIIADAATAQEVVSQVRNLRNNRGLSPKIAVPLAIRTQNQALYEQFGKLIQKLANVSEVTFVTDKVDGALSFMVGTDEYFVKLEQELDVEAEIEKTKKELDYNLGSRENFLKKLTNEKFVANAKPEVVESERKKLADVEAKINTLQERLVDLRK